jgi:hypothetical protein
MSFIFAGPIEGSLLTSLLSSLLRLFLLPLWLLFLIHCLSRNKKKKRKKLIFWTSYLHLDNISSHHFPSSWRPIISSTPPDSSSTVSPPPPPNNHPPPDLHPRPSIISFQLTAGIIIPHHWTRIVRMFLHSSSSFSSCSSRLIVSFIFLHPLSENTPSFSYLYFVPESFLRRDSF